MSRLAVRVLCVLVGGAFTAPALAQADLFEPIRAVSEGTLNGGAHVEQAEVGEHAVISGNGEYVAFQGRFGGVKGIWRRDLASGAIELVATGEAALPSISESGQYVSFTTNAQLAPHDDTNHAPDVYVRDMSVPESQQPSQPCEEEEAGASPAQRCPFTLVSAVNDGTQGLEYEGASQYGAVASGRTAISADGRVVAFVTTAVSDLAGPGTPAEQVAIRELSTRETKLVSAEADPATGQPITGAEGHDLPVSTTAEGEGIYGAVYSGLPEPTAFPFTNPWVGASISADGSTVAWMGQEIGKQAQVLAEDQALQPDYTEPLWRRISEGPQAPTRRVTGGSDPSAPGCAASGETKLGLEGTLSDPCQGPFETKTGQPQGVWTLDPEFDYLPQLSANGEAVVFIANEREIASGLEFASNGESGDLYVVNMQPGLTRVQALRRLTEVAGSKEVTRDGTIEDFAIAPDFGITPEGSQIAFSTARTVFPLDSPAYVSVPMAEAGLAELFEVDVDDDTLTRISHGFQSEAQPSEQAHIEGLPGQDPYKWETEGSFSPSFSDDGGLLAFASSASNLVYGDGNDASDAFTVEREIPSSQPTPQYISSEPAPPGVTPTWLLGVTALSRPDGSVELDAEVPGVGSLHAAADGSVRVRVLAPRKGRKARRAGASSGRARMTVATRAVASATKATPAGGGLVTLRLTLAPRYRALAGAAGGLSATVSVLFSAPGHRTLSVTIPVTFRRTTKAAKAKKKKKKARRAADGRAGATHRSTR
jgi:hypothetical protein